MEIRSEKPEKARELLEEASSVVESFTGQKPEPGFVNFGANYPVRYKAGGMADPISDGVYITNSFLDIEFMDGEYTVIEHELDHIVHYSTIFDDELDQDYLEELEDNIDELLAPIHDENFALKFTLGGYAHKEYTGHVYTGNFEALAAFNHPQVDSQVLKDKIKDFEELSEKEKRKNRRRYRSDEIKIGKRNKLKREVDGRFAYAVNEEARNLLEEVEVPEELQKIRERTEKVAEKDVEVEIESNARMIEFFERTDLKDLNPYESELEEEELEYIGDRLESARDFYRFGEGISKRLAETIETFYRMKQVYKEAGVDEPGQEAAENVVKAGIERLKEI